MKRQRARSVPRRWRWLLLLGVLLSGLLLTVSVGRFVERDLRGGSSRLLEPMLDTVSEIVARLVDEDAGSTEPAAPIPAKIVPSPSIEEPAAVVEETPRAAAEIVDPPPPVEPEPEPIAAPPTGPWDAALAEKPSPFETAWPRWSLNPGATVGEENLRVWLDPVDAEKDRFFTVVRKTVSFAGIDGLFRLRAPLPEGAALRLSLPEHRSLRLHVQSGDQGVMIQAHDANDLQRNLRKQLEEKLRAAEELHRAALVQLNVKRDATREPESRIAGAKKRVDEARAQVKRLEDKKPAARKAASEADATYRKATKEKADALREAPRASQRGREARRRLDKARREHRKEVKNQKLLAAVRRAEKEVDEADRKVAESARRRNDSLQRFARTGTAKREADRRRRSVDQEASRAQRKLRSEERRVRDQIAKARLLVVQREDAARHVEAMEAGVKTARAGLDEATRQAATESSTTSSTPDAWAAYATSRSPDRATRRPTVLLATDEGRMHSTDLRKSNRLELRYQEGRVLLTRGDVTILHVPLDGPPTEVLLGGYVLIEDIAMVRTTRVASPTAWQTVTLPPPEGDEKAWVPGPQGARRIDTRAEVFELEIDALAGIGIDLAVSDGKVVASLEYAPGLDDGQCVVEWKKNADADADANADAVAENRPTIDQRVLPLVRVRHRVRFLFGIEHVKCWVRTDNAPWAIVGQPRRTGGQRVASLTLRRSGDPEARGVTVHDWSRSTLRELGSVFAEAQALPFEHPAATSLDDWRQKTLSQKPEDLDDDEWLIACACRSLREASSAQLADPLMDLVREHPSIRARSTTEQYRLLDELCLLSDLSTDDSRLRRMVDRYRRVAVRAGRRQERRVFENLRRALLDAPTHTRFPISATDSELAAYELLALLYRQQWRDAEAFCRKLRFYSLDLDGELLAWTRSLLEMRLPQSVDWPHTRLPEGWRHPLIEEIEKELYNDLADFHAAVASDDDRSAGQLALDIDPRTLRGVGPSDSDRRLFVSLPTAIVSTRRQTPGLWARMTDAIGPRSLLRVRRSITRGDVRGVEQATVQYRGTEASREAHRWLGDRALAAGDFLAATAHFSLARDAERESVSPQLAARMRLAAAMLGHDVPGPMGRSVEISGVEMRGREFEALLRDLRHRGDKERSSFVREHASPVSAGDFPSRSRLTTRVHDHLEGIPNGELHGAFRDPGTPTALRRAERALAVDVRANRVFINSGVDVSALDLRTGLRLWTSQRQDYRQPDAWPLTSLRPLLAQDRVFTRLWGQSGPQLVCLSQHDGSEIWRRNRTKADEWICDPMAHGGRLFVLSVTQPNAEGSRLRLVHLDAATGAELRSFDLAKLRRSWWSRKTASATANDRWFVASLGGVVLRADFTGRVHWIRKQLVVPADAYVEKTQRMVQRPLISGQDIIVAQPGVVSLECIDATSGQLRWQFVDPDLESLRGVTAGVVLLATDSDLRAVDRESGELAWTNESLSWRDPTYLAGDGQILGSSTTEVDGVVVPELIWIDAQTGHIVERRRLDGLPDAAPRLGPIFTTPHRAWALFARGSQGTRLHLVEIAEK